MNLRSTSKPKKKRGKFEMSDDSENSDVENGVKVKLEDDDDDDVDESSSDAENETDVKSEVKSEASEEGKENIRGSGLLTLR